MDTPRVCATCKHFRFTPAEGDLSEVTPGSDVAISCVMRKWSIDVYEETEDGYRQKMLAAVNCQAYRLVEIAPLELPPSPPMPASLDDLKAEYPELDMHCGCTGRRAAGHTYAAWWRAPGVTYATQSPTLHHKEDAMRWLVDQLALWAEKWRATDAVQAD